MNEDVIREFMVRIGYQTDETSLKKFRVSLEGITKVVLSLGAAVAATAGAVIAGVKILSSQMESLYYSSQRTGETVGNIMALRSAASQIGLTADQAQSSLEGFVQSLRMNPGKAGLLAELGVTGRTPLELYDNFIEKTKSMAPYVAAAYAQLFGIDPVTLQMQQIGHEKALAAEAAYRQKLAAFHINPEQAAEAGVGFNNSIRRLTDDVHLFWVLLQEHLAPVLDTIVSKFEKWELGHADQVAWKIAAALQAVSNWVSQINWEKVGGNVDKFLDRAARVGAAIAKIVDWLGGGDGKPSPPEGAPKTGNPLVDWFNHPVGQITRNRPVEAPPVTGGVPASPSDRHGFFSWLFGSVSQNSAAGGSGTDPTNPSNLFAGLEKKFNLPSGWLDTAWNAESSRGKNMLSPAGAEGHFGFMPATAQEYGLKDPSNLAESAAAAAKKFHDLFVRYAGDAMKAAAAYNWGDGNLNKDISEHGDAWRKFLPSETSGYLGQFENVRLGASGQGAAMPIPNLTQTTTVNVHGSPDPIGTGRSVANEQARVNADLTRKFMVATR